MRITIIVPTLCMGGMELQAINQANELSRRGIPVQMIVLSDATDLKHLLSKDVIVFSHNNPSLKVLDKKALLNVFSAIKGLKKPIREFGPDHIIANLPLSVTVVRLMKLMRITNAKVWPYHHSTQYQNAPINTVGKHLYHHLLVRSISRNDEHHLYVSQAVKKDIEANERIKTGTVLYNAAPTPERDWVKHQEILSFYGLKSESYIIIPGRLHPVKGHLFFLSATEKIIKDYQLKVMIVGSGPEENSIRNYITKHNLEQNIILSGHLENKDVLELIAGSYMCVIPSLIEGLGNVAIESLAVGTTVLCSSAGGLPEVISDRKNGFVFEKGNALDLQQKFRSVIVGETRLIPSETLIEDFNKKFTVQYQIDHLLLFMKN